MGSEQRISDERLRGLAAGFAEGRGFYGDTDTVAMLVLDLRDARTALAESQRTLQNCTAAHQAAGDRFVAAESALAESQRTVAALRQGMVDLMKGFAGHYAHWDAEGNAGRTCPACISEADARDAARKLLVESGPAAAEWERQSKAEALKPLAKQLGRIGGAWDDAAAALERLWTEARAVSGAELDGDFQTMDAALDKLSDEIVTAHELFEQAEAGPPAPSTSQEPTP